jgi:hypothetical protein
MEKTQQEPTFKRSGYLSSDGKDFYCAFLVANDLHFAFPDMKTAIGEGLRQRVEYANIVHMKGQRKSSDICRTKGDCIHCETFKDYENRARMPDKILQHILGSLQSIE